MNTKAFSELRDIARQKRDSDIERAKAEYIKTIQNIAELEARLISRPKRNKARSERIKLVDLIYSVLPNDRPFSVDDVLGFVREAEPERKITKATVNTSLNRILNAGSIKRVRYAKAGKSALFAMPDLEVECEKTMMDWAKEIEGWQNMEPVQIMVEMVERGYEMTSPPNESVRSLGRELCRGSNTGKHPE